ncbi:MAG TPA: hypothetical protein VFR48_08770, partial [Solirubrobacteraceae bacterium]|nr:hypothetical protein [Solirubrobacteraceae bacterium]
GLPCEVRIDTGGGAVGVSAAALPASEAVVESVATNPATTAALARRHRRSALLRWLGVGVLDMGSDSFRGDAVGVGIPAVAPGGPR